MVVFVVFFLLIDILLFINFVRNWRYLWFGELDFFLKRWIDDIKCIRECLLEDCWFKLLYILSSWNIVFRLNFRFFRIYFLSMCKSVVFLVLLVWLILVLLFNKRLWIFGFVVLYIVENKGELLFLFMRFIFVLNLSMYWIMLILLCCMVEWNGVDVLLIRLEVIKLGFVLFFIKFFILL